MRQDRVRFQVSASLRVLCRLVIVLSLASTPGIICAETITLLPGSELTDSFLSEPQFRELSAVGPTSFTINIVTGLNPGEVPIFAGNQFVGTAIFPGTILQPSMTGFTYIQYPGVPSPVGFTGFLSGIADPTMDLRQPAIADFVNAAEIGGHSPLLTSDNVSAGSLGNAPGLFSTSIEAGLNQILRENGLDPTITGTPSFTGVQVDGGNVAFLFSSSVDAGSRATAPEPGSLALLATGLGLFGWLRRRSLRS